MRRLAPSSIVALVAAACLAGSVVYAFPVALSDLAGDVRASRSFPAPLHALSGAFQTDIDRGYLVAAKRLIPPHATYYFDQGTEIHSGNTASAFSAAPVTQFWLYPRRPLLRSKHAQWLICYGCDFDPWKGRATIYWQRGGIYIGVIER